MATSKHRYEITLYWSDEDQAYVAEVPELPGCFADGPSYLDAIANVEDVIDGWIETATAMGRAVPEAKAHRIRHVRR